MLYQNKNNHADRSQLYTEITRTLESFPEDISITMYFRKSKSKQNQVNQLS